jgi:hypothetical protein
MAKPIGVYFEAGKSRVFACSLDWPGWCRRGKTEQDALDALTEYAPRYALIAKRAGVAFPAVSSFDVVERHTGSAHADFGAIGAIPAADSQPLTAAAAKRQGALVRAAWDEFDEVSSGAPAQLRKGPRGGGRDRDKMIDHILESEVMYASKLGLKLRQPAVGDETAIEVARTELLTVLSGASDGQPLKERGWPSRYAARRIAWHVLDHLWELQDRS